MAHADLMNSLLKMMTFPIGLLVVGAICFFTKRWVDQKTGTQIVRQQIQVLATKRIGPKVNISMLKVPGAILVVGIGSNGVNLLAEIGEQDFSLAASNEESHPQ